MINAGNGENMIIKEKQAYFAIRALAFGMAAGIIFVSQSIPTQAAPKKMKDGTVFDAEYYAKTYPDVAAVYGSDEMALYQHYVEYGKKENRRATADSGTDTFDAKYYAEQNPDVVAVYGIDRDSLYQHYLQYGKKEGRKPSASAETALQKTEQEPKVPSEAETAQTQNSPANEKVLRRGEAVSGYSVIKSQSEYFGFPIEDCFETSSGVYVVCKGWICQMFDNSGNGSYGQHALWYLGSTGLPYDEYGRVKEGVHFWKMN